MTWSPGADRIRELIESGELETVEPSIDVARRLVEDAANHTSSAGAISEDGDLTGAYQLAYDAIRKSAAALLAVQGLRATSRGGHIAIQDAATAQFESTVPAFRQFGRLRRDRNRFEYPSDVASEPAEDDVVHAIGIANEVVTKAQKILNEDILGLWAG